MNKQFQEFIERLRTELEAPLPGAEAHREMAPRLNYTPRTPGDDVRLGGVLILLYPREDRVLFPLIKRPEYDGVHSGQIALPGGGMEPHDEDLRDTALREAEEEIGVISRDVEVIGELSDFFVEVSNFVVRPVVGAVDYIPEFIPEPGEVAGVIDASVQDLLDSAKRKRKTLNVRSMRINTPYFDIEDQTVWGATAMMLSEFSRIISRI